MTPRVLPERPPRLPAALLAACVIGLVLSPLGYVATGALGDFRASFALVALPLLVASIAFLLWRYLRAARDDARGAGALGVAEALGIAVVVGFLVLASGARLTRGAQRVGIAAGFALAATVIALALVLPRRSALEARLARVPRGAAVAALVALLLAALAAVGVALATPARFP
jgi:hypothetical protein